MLLKQIVNSIKCPKKISVKMCVIEMYYQIKCKDKTENSNKNKKANNFYI